MFTPTLVIDGNEAIEFEHPVRTALPVFMHGAPSHEWLWCFDCERAFQLAEVRDRDHPDCPYHDCGAQPLDFWQWEAYRAFVGDGPVVPEPETRYPLAA